MCPDKKGSAKQSSFNILTRMMRKIRSIINRFKVFIELRLKSVCVCVREREKERERERDRRI